MDKKARQVEKVRNFGYNYGTRVHMSDAKPYTLERFDMDCEMDDLSSVAHRDIRATVEALERAERERDEAQEERYEARLARQRAEKQRDEARGELFAANYRADDLADRLNQAEAERDALKAALRDMLRATSNDGLLVEMMTAKEMRQRAHEALEEVES